MVCLCAGVSERKVRRAIDEGAKTITEVSEVCRAGNGCGGCHPTIDSLLVEALDGVPVAPAVGYRPAFG